MRPFTVHIAPAMLQKMTKRMKDTRWPDQIKDSGWQYGVPFSYMKGL